MTKILAFADTQLGVTTVPLEEQRKVLDKIVQVALERQVDLVLHGGDVFEGPVVLPEHFRCFIDATEPLRCTHPHTPLLIIRGNGRHDMAVRNVHALDVLRELPGTAVSDRPQGINARGVDIITLPWVHPGSLIAHLNGHVDHDQINLTASELLVEIARRLRAQADPSVPSVLLAHWAISGSKLPSGLAVEDMREPILPWADLDALGFDIVIGAHIHEPQMISDPSIDQGPGIVLGSPQQLNFGEHGDHGCWLIELGDAGALAEFVPIKSPRFVTLDYDFVAQPEGMTLAPMAAMQGPHDPESWAEGNMVRLRYRCTEDQARTFDSGTIRNAILAAGAASVKIEPQIMKASRARAEGISEQLSQVEALVQWCAANGVDDVMRERMLARFQEWS